MSVVSQTTKKLFKSTVPGVAVLAPVTASEAEILSPQALQFVATLQRIFNPTRKTLLQKRVLRQQELDRGVLPDFLPETAYIRNDPNWRAAPPAPGLQDRRVEITGPVDRKMVINALNSGAYTFMADFEGKKNYLHDCIKRHLLNRFVNCRFYCSYLGKYHQWSSQYA